MDPDASAVAVGPQTSTQPSSACYSAPVGPPAAPCSWTPFSPSPACMFTHRRVIPGRMQPHAASLGAAWRKMHHAYVYVWLACRVVWGSTHEPSRAPHPRKYCRSASKAGDRKRPLSTPRNGLSSGGQNGQAASGGRWVSNGPFPAPYPTRRRSTSTAQAHRGRCPAPC